MPEGIGSALTPEKSPPWEAPAETPAPAPAAEAAPVAPEPVAAPPPPPTPGISEALRGLMDREASLRAQQDQLKSESQAIAEAKQLRELAKSDPLAFLHETGTSYEDLTQRVLAGDRPDPNQDIRKELAELKSQLASRSSREEEQRKANALQEAQTIVKNFVESSADYPLTKAADMHGLVYQRIYDHYTQTGQALSEAAAAKDVEQYLTGIREKWLSGEAPAQQKPESQLTTLTNAMSAQQPTRYDKEDPGMLSESESIRRAAALIQWNDDQ